MWDCVCENVYMWVTDEGGGDERARKVGCMDTLGGHRGAGLHRMQERIAENQCMLGAVRMRQVVQVVRARAGCGGEQPCCRGAANSIRHAQQRHGPTPAPIHQPGARFPGNPDSGEFCPFSGKIPGKFTLGKFALGKILSQSAHFSCGLNLSALNTYAAASVSK